MTKVFKAFEEEDHYTEYKGVGIILYRLHGWCGPLLIGFLKLKMQVLNMHIPSCSVSVCIYPAYPFNIFFLCTVCIIYNMKKPLARYIFYLYCRYLVLYIHFLYVHL